MEMALTQQEAEWVALHQYDDVAQLRLRYGGDARMGYLILQVECRRKAVRKLPRELSSSYFIFPTRLSAEQCSADQVASWHAQFVKEGWNVVDLTSGLGIDAMQMSDNADSVVAVECDARLVAALLVNASVCGHDNLIPVHADCIEWLKDYAGDRMDMAFIDPARRGDGGERVYGLGQCSPDVVGLLPAICKVAHRLLVKASPMLDITQTVRDMPGASDVYAVGTADECKEVAVYMDLDNPAEVPLIHAVTLSDKGSHDFAFTAAEEREAEYSIGAANAGGYLYEPSPAVMKAGAFKLLCGRTGAKVLHPNTHLYVSDVCIVDFPGQAYKVAEIMPWASKNIKALASKRMPASVSVRNFKMPVNKVREKLRCKESADRRLIVTTTTDGPQMILCERI